MRCLVSLLIWGLLGATVWPGEPVDERPLPIAVANAFPDLRIPRPVLVTHPGDHSNRLFVASQYGVIYVFPRDSNAADPEPFLDIHNRVAFKDIEDEKGFLGLAFHPHYAENGRFFVNYTTEKGNVLTTIVSEFHVSAHDRNRADPDSERVLLRIVQPYINHNGGTIVFGPDGFLYIAMGDGGQLRDFWDNGQNLRTLHGSILRIDVDRRTAARPYAIPPDNPFVNRCGARPEIWAYGFRNVWRMAFDRPTGLLWAADNGEDLWEEVDIVQRGGNYGWALREGRHRFGKQGSGPRADLIEPIWEYYHKIGKSIIGGCVYRGTRHPELVGCYLYGDYVVGDIWALRYDFKTKRVVANRPIQTKRLPIMSFGEDEDGEIYVTTMMSGGIIYTLVKHDTAAAPAASSATHSVDR